jgi:hypothetical protein
MHFTDFLPCLVFVIGVALLLLAGERRIDRVACAKCNRVMHRRRRQAVAHWGSGLCGV